MWGPRVGGTIPDVEWHDLYSLHQYPDQCHFAHDVMRTGSSLYVKMCHCGRYSESRPERNVLSISWHNVM